MIDPSKERKKQIVDTICIIIALMVWVFTPYFTDPITFAIIFFVTFIIIDIIHTIAMTMIDLNPPFVIYVYDTEKEEEV